MVYNNCKGIFTLTENSMKNRIEELRKDRGINQQELARAIRVSRQTISSIQNGKYNPSLELAFIISDYFQLPIEDIFLYKGG